LHLTEKEMEVILSKVTGITQDSRAVKRGYMFVAVPGRKTDGSRFIADAIHNGATVALVGEEELLPEEAKGVEVIRASDPRRSLALLAARYYRFQPQTIAAVTGTNGKTSVVHFARQLWEALDVRAACLGTLGVQWHGYSRPGSLTTPDPVKLHAELADIAAAGITHLAMEASSHGLDQYRLDGVKVGVAGFTNLSRDHLDYHGDRDSYFKSKKRLFAELLVEGGAAVLNADIPEYEELRKISEQRNLRIIDYGKNAAFLKALSIDLKPEGCQLEAKAAGKDYSFLVPLAGSFQAMNVLCALGLVMAEEPDNHERNARLISTAGKLQGAPGRLQFVGGHPRGAAVYVDYAHTPDALENVLNSLRPHTKGKLFCIAGCGGDRDPGKRPVMGRIGSELSDCLIITDDNPRSEDPAQIRKAMMEAASGATEIAGRADAIRRTLADLNEGDVLIVAGKGHEGGQIIGDRVEPFDDVEEVKKAINVMERIK
jgi:UDP-N-acetylmuramoyl-L-alanyl-D-glutamate--2,6-diaminopimelate ligase